MYMGRILLPPSTYPAYEGGSEIGMIYNRGFPIPVQQAPVLGRNKLQLLLKHRTTFKAFFGVNLPAKDDPI